MIPNIETGKSFRGAQLYYMHDKRQRGELLRLSEERVAWTETRNTAHDAADDAFAEMTATARDQDHLKIMSGVRLSGRPCEQPVMTISLSWHPSEKPGKDGMIRAADTYLEHMGWEEHQAVYIAHNDTPHPHVHIILNRVHPDTGKVLDDAFSKNRTQEWARDYEKEHGRIWCEERVGKDYSRADGKEPNSLPHDFALDAREAQRGYAELEEAARTLDRREREQLAQHHQDEREAFFETRHQQFREVRQAAYREVRDEYKPRWREHFREAEQRRDRAERDAAVLAIHVLDCARRGDFAAAWQAVADRDAIRQQLEQQIAGERRALRAEQRAETRERQDEACPALYEERALAFTRIKQRQKEERAELKELQAARSEAQPYDSERLVELVTEPAADRLTEPSREPDPGRGADADDLKAPEAAQDAPQPEAAPDREPVPELGEQRLAEPEAGIPHDPAATEVVPDRGKSLAGGIGKLAEILADAIAGILAPETEKERAQQLAARAKQEPTREEPAPQPQGGGTSFSFDAYFGEHGERLRREQAEYWKERNDVKEKRER